LTALLAALCAADDVDCQAMRTKQLRTFLAERGLKCEGCAEKQDFVAMCEEHKDTPPVAREEVPSAGAEKPPAGNDNIEDILASLKGMPGMEGLKVFGADDLKNLNAEQMARDMGGKPPRRSRAEWREELVDFYTRYDLTEKIDGVDAALDKWKGRESRMMDALYKKYDDKIRAASPAADDSKEEL